ncbi:MAG: glycosyltransferase [Anaerohalosphaera sp.]|nr:glycosyltransferase [Anaerohalosphaera sp.]
MSTRQNHKVLVLSVGAGSGHNRCGQALEKAFSLDDRVEQVEYIDCLNYTNAAFKEIYSNQFLKVVQNAPNLWGWAFDKTDVPWDQNNIRELIERLHTKKLVSKIMDFQPDICVCTHFMPAEIISRLLRKNKFKTHLSVVVTDFYVHASWLTELFCRYFVPHEEGVVQLEAAGFDRERINVCGIPIDPVFSERKDKAKLRDTFGLEHDVPVILLSAGAAGTMRAEEIIKFLESIQSPCQFVIICGRNETLKNELDIAVASRPEDAKKFHVLGFTTQMDEYMTTADLFIGKPGGLTTSECLAKALPMVIWDPVPGQEVYNSIYLLENGAAVSPTAATTLGYKVDKILKTPGRVEAMKKAAESISHPDSAREVAQTVLDNAQELPVKVFCQKD